MKTKGHLYLDMFLGELFTLNKIVESLDNEEDMSPLFLQVSLSLRSAPVSVFSVSCRGRVQDLLTLGWALSF